MGEAAQLGLDRGVDLGDAVAEEVAPQGRGGVEEAPPLGRRPGSGLPPRTTSKGSLAAYSAIWVKGCQT